MADNFHVAIPQLPAYVAKMRGAPAVVTDEMGKAGRRAGLLVERLAKSRAPVWRGHLRRSITSTASPFGTTISAMTVTTSIGSNLPYAETKDKGRRPGRTAPPTRAIAEWLSAVGGDPKAAWVIARSIGRDGIPGTGYLTKSFNELKPRIRTEFRSVTARVIARLR